MRVIGMVTKKQLKALVSDKDRLINVLADIRETLVKADMLFTRSDELSDLDSHSASSEAFNDAQDQERFAKESIKRHFGDEKTFNKYFKLNKRRVIKFMKDESMDWEYNQ